ncbi:MAG TPA: POTRA domain-containing protein, partial [Bacteroidota bacterium]
MWRSSKRSVFFLTCAKAFVLLALGAGIVLEVRAQQPPPPEVYRILGVSVEGQRSADAAAIIANTGLKVGDEITVPGQQTRIAIERLYGLRLFDDVQIFIENRTPEGVYLLIRVRENPRLDRVEVDGNDELSEDDVLKTVNMVRGQIVSQQEISWIIRELKAKYDEEGYLNAVITPETIPSEDTTSRRVILKLTVNEGEKIVVDNIRFYGNTQFDDDDLTGEMKETSARTWWKFWQSNKFDKKKYEEDKKFILAFYRKNGYRDVEILSDSISYSPDNKYVTLDMYLFEGPQYKIRNITWEGNTVYPDEALTARLGFRTGDIYDTGKLDENLYRNEAENDVSSLYMNNGYLFFQVDPEENRVGQDSVDLTFRVRERNKFKIGQVRVTGNTKTYEKVIRRELYTRPGDDFSRELVLRSARQLAQLNYFNPEKIKPDVKPV